MGGEAGAASRVARTLRVFARNQFRSTPQRRQSMNPVIHFEMPAEDRKRMAEFYEKAFDWETKMLGPDMGKYVVVTTTESDDRGPKKPGAINGGFFIKDESKPGQYPSVVIAV